MFGMIRSLAAIGAVLAALVGPAGPAGPAGAAEWPAKPVRIVVPYGPGGAADTLARLFADVLGTALARQFYVENRPGGGSVVGSEMVARSAPDGTTFALTGISTHVLAP